MSKESTNQAHRIAVNDGNVLGCGRGHPFGITFLETEFAAAEERGRRRGLEERDELRACLELALMNSNSAGVTDMSGEGAPLRCRACLGDSYVYGGDHSEDRHEPGCWVPRARAAIAPRDSAPVAHVCKCKGDSTARFFDGGHLPNCPVVAPRDSGEEGQR